MNLRYSMKDKYCFPAMLPLTYAAYKRSNSGKDYFADVHDVSLDQVARLNKDATF